MNNNVISLYKPPGMTPLEAIEMHRMLDPELRGQILGYAGRLDPMAEGVLVVLIGDENKKRKLYERFPKTYEFEILIGISTDSYDGLGMITGLNEIPGDWKEKLVKIVDATQKEFDQPYPPYSAARVKGKPLFYWAREGKIDEIIIPSKRVSIESYAFLEFHTSQIEHIVPELTKRISHVKGEFRQKEIIASWEGLIQRNPRMKVGIARISLSCSSGLYIRSLCNDWGHQMKTGGFAYSIKRTAVGEMTSDKARKLT